MNIKKPFTNWASTTVFILYLLFLFTSCKKESTTKSQATIKNFATLGLYELSSSNYRAIYIPITTVGNNSTDYFLLFDTGSSGMTMDANGILPASMITSSGIQVTGDFTTINGITITSMQSSMSYGGVNDEIIIYGNLAYADLGIGDQSGLVKATHVPFFLYYKAVDVTTGVTLPVHSFDVFGVGPGVSYANNQIGSPLNYFNLPQGLTSGFKLSLLDNNSFISTGAYVSNLLTIGLTSSDLTSSGFTMHPLTFNSTGGYSPDINANISYSGQKISADILFDSGNSGTSVIENNAAANGLNQLPISSAVAITTNEGFSYQYTTTSTFNFTYIENPSYSLDSRSIFSIDFFISNEFLIDYKNHQIGLKNN